MLYISRKIGKNKYGVVDTDDGIETAVTYSELVKYIRLGIMIDGVELTTCSVRGERTLGIKSINVRQEASSVSTLQIKTKVMRGVEVKLQGDLITKIDWDDATLKLDTCIRLSDYGKRCASCIFETDWMGRNTTLIVELDDSVKYNRDTFRCAFRAPVKFDLMKVKNLRTVSWVYEEYYARKGRASLLESIVDYPERMNEYAAIGVVNSGQSPDNLVFSDETMVKVEQRFYERFKGVVESPLRFVSTSESRRKAKEYYRTIRKERQFWRSNCQDFHKIVSADGFMVFLVVMDFTTVNRSAMSQFASYMHWLDATERVQELYVQLVNKVNNWVLDLGWSMNW